MDKNSYSRRIFIKQAMLASAVAAVSPGLLSARPKLAAANERVNLACIGIGNRGAQIINDLYNTGLCNIVALCDVDMGAPHTVDILKKFPDVPRFQDFRQLFDKMGNQIDAVSIGVPDFSHFPIAMHAMGLGIHVYVEKPLSRTFQESELLMKAARKYKKVVTQMGNQGHSEANYFQFKTWVEAGIIKDVTAITAHMNSPRRWHGWDPNIKSFPPAESIPDTLDWDLWHSAVAKQHDYNHDYINGQWRCWYDFGMGALGDWGAHIIDTAHQFLDLGLPYEVECTKATGHNDFFYPMSSTIVFRFPERKRMPALDITWYDGLDNLPPIPEGYGVSGLDPNIPPPSTGDLEPVKLNPGKIIYSKELTFKGGSHGSTLSIIPEEKAKEMASRLPEVPESPSNHFANFLKACKGEEETRSRFEISGPLSQVFCLGVLSQKLKTKLEFDRKKKIITNNKIANELLVGPPPRKGWEQYYQV
ncbi:Gfo/Idh/MocA family oxidoreductase [Parapedobacter indicus]|uniref:Oxidoreductase family, NAD-binding Rossmann fold n=1 Tax=Parapedobacter indicus TaxID=1477437 RepID=A0A1I3CEQ1_9SPHI|nr:Gfo/Idh/MocA family oxidoreductase [Parapedobacter indicus]PPL04215.1 oxidoreductase family protein [Parapedobacter indicus]SFH72955.1 Oxidoreductase family, NAD-binding Rossmann fold [Parapedobacter indicus]